MEQQTKNVIFMKKAIWISYDLGIGGDYDGLYRWLANHDVVREAYIDKMLNLYNLWSYGW